MARTTATRRRLRFGRRSRELAYLSVALLAVVLAYATAYAAQRQVVDATSLLWCGAFIAIGGAAHVAVRRWTPLADPYLLPAVILLCGLGVTMINRLEPALASRQTIWLIVSVSAMAALLALLPDHKVLERYKYVIGLATVVVLVITISPLGMEVRGAQLWIRLGPVNIQPGEFAKLGIVIFLAAYLRENRELLSLGVSPRHMGPLVLFWGASLALLVLMNDFGTSLLFYGSFLLLVYVATGRLWYVAFGLVAFVLGSLLVVQVAPHVGGRFDIWLDPWSGDRAQNAGYQLVQGLFAMADGGLFGRGLGQAYLVTDGGQTLIPDAHTDFIFAALADELGFVGAVPVLLLYVVIAWRGYAIAARSVDGFSKLLCFGLATVFALQVIIIVGGVVRLLPLTGQTLPFVSYGGSSVLANFLLVGLLLVASNRAAQQSLDAAGAGAGAAAGMPATGAPRAGVA